MDQVLNLSAFGDIIPDPNKKNLSVEEPDLTFGSFMKSKEPEREPNKRQESLNGINELSREALCHSAQIKLFHWQTRSYAEHKALDEMFLGFIKLTDDLIESVMGKYGRPNFGGECQIKVMDYSQKDLERYLDSIYYCYSEDCKGIFDSQKDSEILNIIDEIIALIDKTKYLLSLK